MPRNPFLDQVPPQEFPLTSYYLQSKLRETSVSSSFASSSISASYAFNATSASYAFNATSASYALTASFALNASPFPYTGSARITGSLGVTGSISVLSGSLNIINQSGSNVLNTSTLTLNNDNGSPVVSWGNGLLRYGGVTSLDWGNRLLVDLSGNTSANWESRILYDLSTSSSIDWDRRQAIDSATNLSIDWENRRLQDNVGNVILDWQSGMLEGTASWANSASSVPPYETAWTSYTPKWTAQTGTQPSLGNGILSGSYKQIGKTVFVEVRFRGGSTTTYGDSTSNAWLFSLPVTASKSDTIIIPAAISNNIPAWYQATVAGGYAGSTTNVALIVSNGTSGSIAVDYKSPFTWSSTSGSLYFNGTYEAS